jgi:hypothetical protein
MKGSKIFKMNTIHIRNNQRTIRSCLVSLCNHNHNFNTENYYFNVIAIIVQDSLIKHVRFGLDQFGGFRIQ